MGDLAPWRRRAGTQQPATTDGRERDRRERRDDERDPVGTGGLDADDGEEGGEDNSERTFAPQEDAVGAEAGVAGERAPGEELAEVRREPADQPGKQRRIALEHVLVERACEHQRDHDQDHRQDTSEHCRAHEDRTSALIAHASCGDGSPRLLLERQEEPRTADEEQRPEHRERRKTSRPEGARRDHQEAVLHQTGEPEPYGDRDRPHRQGQRAHPIEELHDQAGGGNALTGRCLAPPWRRRRV